MHAMSAYVYAVLEICINRAAVHMMTSSQSCRQPQQVVRMMPAGWLLWCT